MHVLTRLLVLHGRDTAFEVREYDLTDRWFVIGHSCTGSERRPECPACYCNGCHMDGISEPWFQWLFSFLLFILFLFF